MFIFNVKVNKMRFVKFLLAFMAIFCLLLAIIGFKKIFFSNSTNDIFYNDSNCMPSNEIAYLTNENYTNILKEVHENLNDYIGQKICYTGYVYRIPEIEKNQFILARDMQISSTNQTVVVGFLCTTPQAENYETYSWVKITGTIQKGNYLGEIPCIEINEIENVSEPENRIVSEPNEKFIQTSVIY